MEVDSVETLIRALADTPPDLVLLDWRLYGSPAPETCRLLQRAYPCLKIVLLSVDCERCRRGKGGRRRVHLQGSIPGRIDCNPDPSSA